MESPDSLVGDIMTRTPREVTQRQLHMHTAFVLFKTEPSMERNVFMALSDMSAVTETHALYGEYDLVVRVEAEDSKSLTKLLMGDLRTVDGVKETETLIVVDY